MSRAIESYSLAGGLDASNIGIIILQYKVHPCFTCGDKVSDFNKTQCPYYHNQSDKRRSPFKKEKLIYSPEVCPDLKKSDNSCSRGDKCGMAHNIYETNYHPLVFKLQECLDSKHYQLIQLDVSQTATLDLLMK